MLIDLINWKPEDQLLTKLNEEWSHKKKDVYEAIINQYTFDEQCEILYHYGKGNIKRFMKLRDKFLEAVERGEIKKQKNGWNTYNTASVKAWCKRNGKTNTYCGYYSDVYDEYMSFSRYGGMKLNSKDEVFVKGAHYEMYELLEHFERQEREWFREHDEYTILNDEVFHILNKNYRIEAPHDANFRISTGSKNYIVPYNADKDKVDWDDKRNLTIEEMKAIIEFQTAFEKATEDYFKAYFPIKNF